MTEWPFLAALLESDTVWAKRGRMMRVSQIPALALHGSGGRPIGRGLALHNKSLKPTPWRTAGTVA